MFARSQKTDREEYLEGELDRYREAEERRQREADEERKQLRKQIRQRHEEAMRSADDWPEALDKQILLCRREVGMIDDDTPPEEDYFEQTARACERALVIWREVESGKQVEIDELERRIAKIREGICNGVADKLESENNSTAWSEVAYALREETPERFLDW